MAFNAVAFAEAAPGVNGTLAVALNEGLYQVAGDDLFVTKEAPYLLGVFAAAESTGGRVRLRQPKEIDIDIQKICLTTDLDPIQGWTHQFGRPLALVPGTKLNATMVNATDEDTIVGLLLGGGKIRQAVLDEVNPTHIINGYGDTTLAVANTWENIPITWNEDLPKGSYAVVGMKVGVFLAANLWSAMARLSIPGNQRWKPGVPCALMEADHEEFQSITTEPWAKWPLMPEIVFQNTTMPNIELVSPSLITDENVQLELVKIA